MAAEIKAILAQLSKTAGVGLQQQDLGLRDTLTAFVHAINWRERNVLALCAVHCALLLVVLLTRRQVEVQAVLLVLIGVVITQTERANVFLAANWRRSGWTQNYFDTSGFFMLAMVTAPLLVIVLVQVVSMLWQATDLLVTAKRAQLRSDARAAGKKGGGALAFEDLPKKTM